MTTTEAFLIIMLIAAIGGAMRSLLGYLRQPEEAEFHTKKFIGTMMTQVIISMFIVFGTSSIFEQTIGAPQFFMAFFLAVDVQTMMKSRK